MTEQVKNVTVVLADADWEGLYVNGKLVYENHNMDFKEILDILTRVGVEVKLASANDDWLFQLGTYPEDEADVMWAVDE